MVKMLEKDFGERSMHEQGFINSTNACESIENNIESEAIKHG